MNYKELMPDPFYASNRVFDLGAINILDTWEEIATAVLNGGIVSWENYVIYGMMQDKEGINWFLARDFYGKDCRIKNGKVYYV